jgi:hypothetical protein
MLGDTAVDLVWVRHAPQAVEHDARRQRADAGPICRRTP